MGILLVYDVSEENSFANVRNWMRQIDQNAAENVNRILIGNKCDADASERVRSPFHLHIFVDKLHRSIIFHMRNLYLSAYLFSILESFY